MEFTKHIPDLVVTGFMGLLWFDVRRAKLNKSEVQKDMDKKMAGYLTETRHELLCKNSHLELSAEIREMKDEILEAIKNNGNKA